VFAHFGPESPDPFVVRLAAAIVPSSDTLLPHPAYAAQLWISILTRHGKG